jgi:hypothetical protein
MADAALSDAEPGLACAMTIAQACAQVLPPGSFGVHCAPTWSAAQTDPFYCGTTIASAMTNCPGYHLRSDVNTDVAYNYYYDAVTSALIAITFVSYSEGGINCVAGPPRFVPPASCETMLPLDPCPDAGM